LWRRRCVLKNHVPGGLARVAQHSTDEPPQVSHWGATPQEYSERPPQPAAYVFAIDVSFHSVSTGVLADTCRAIKESLDHFPRETDLAPSPVKVGFLTYDRNVHFYNLNVRG